jgi:hypothetical protein
MLISLLSKVLLEKLMVARPVEKVLAVSGT